MRGTPVKTKNGNGKKATAPPVVLTTPKGGVYIEYVAVGHLKQWPKNPKKHDLPGIRASIARFGYVAPIVIDEKSGKMVAGHGRLEALEELKILVNKKSKDAVRPKNIQEKDGEWYVPVLRGQDFGNEREAEAYLLADNRHVEVGGWDDDLLRPMLASFREDLNLDALGWSKRELELTLRIPQTSDLAKIPEQKMVGFMASEIKQIVLMLPNTDYEATLGRLAQVMEKAKVKSHTDAVLFLLNFYEMRSRA